MAEIHDLDPVDANNTGRWPENMPYRNVNDAGRADEGIMARWFRDTNASITASGSSNAFAITSNRTIASLANNTLMAFTANHTITGAATLNLNGLGAKAIKRFNGQDLSAGDIISGQPVMVLYKTGADYWFMLNAPAALVTSAYADFSENASPGDPAANVGRVYAKDVSGLTVLAYRDSAGTERIIRGADEAVGALLGVLQQRSASGSDLGGATSGAWTTYPLNSEVYDRLGILSIASNQFTISAAGSYEIDWMAQSYQTEFVTRLQNISDGTTVDYGTPNTSRFGDRYEPQWSRGIARVTIAASKTFAVQYFSNGGDLGKAANQGGAPEIYNSIIIRRG